MAEAWFRRAVAEGLTRLVALSLPGTPPAETIKLTREAWIEALWEGRAWNEADASRIAAGFRALARRVDRWPVPRMLLEHMPSRPEPPKLPAPGPTAEQREHAQRRLRSMLNELTRSMT